MEDKSSIFKEAVSRGQKGELSNFQNWLSQAEITESKYNNLINNLRNEQPFTVDREEAIREIGEYLGSLKAEEVNRHIVLNGVEGSGKTHVSIAIKTLIEENESDLSFTRVVPEDISQENEFSTFIAELENQQQKKVVFIDDVWKEKRISHVLRKLNENIENILVITSWDPEQLYYKGEEIRRSFPQADEIYLEPFDSEQTETLIYKVIDFVSEGESKKEVSNEFISEIKKNSQGVPGLAIKLFEQSIKKSFHSSDRDTLDADSVREVAEKRGITGIREKLRSLSETKSHILEKTLTASDPRGLNPSKIAKELKKDKSTISYHLRDLKNQKLIEKESYGRQTFYTPNPIAKPLIQLHVSGENQFHEHV